MRGSRAGQEEALDSSRSGKLEYRGRLLGRAAREGESPVPEMLWTPCDWYLSTVGHEKPCWKLGGPPSKAKYVMATDSEEVP